MGVMDDGMGDVMCEVPGETPRKCPSAREQGKGRGEQDSVR